MKSNLSLINRDILVIGDQMRRNFGFKHNSEHHEKKDQFDETKSKTTLLTRLRCWSCGLNEGDITICIKCKYNQIGD